MVVEIKFFFAAFNNGGVAREASLSSSFSQVSCLLFSKKNLSLHNLIAIIVFCLISKTAISAARLFQFFVFFLTMSCNRDRREKLDTGSYVPWPLDIKFCDEAGCTQTKTPPRLDLIICFV